MPTTGIVKGLSLRNKIAGTAIAKAETGSISFSAAEEEIQHKDNVTGTVSWTDTDITSLTATISSTAFYAEAESFETIWTAFSAGTALAMTVSTETTGDKNFSGNFIVTALEQTYEVSGRVKYSATFKSKGQITRGTNS